MHLTVGVNSPECQFFLNTKHVIPRYNKDTFKFCTVKCEGYSYPRGGQPQKKRCSYSNEEIRTRKVEMAREDRERERDPFALSEFNSIV